MGWLSTEHLLETQADADGRRKAPQFGQRASAADTVSPLSPLASMERLLRRVLPRALPVVLYMCAPHMKRCDGLYANATRAYAGRVLDVSLTGAALRNVTWNRGVHPNVIAHFLIAEGVARALLDAEGALGRERPTPWPSAPPQFLDPNWERLNAVALPLVRLAAPARRARTSSTLRRSEPAALSTTATLGLMWRPTARSCRPRLIATKHGDEHDRATVAFGVGDGPARILVAMLCSYAWSASRRLRPLPAGAAVGARRCLGLAGRAGAASSAWSRRAPSARDDTRSRSA